MIRYRCRAAATSSRARMPAITSRSFRRPRARLAMAAGIGKPDPGGDVGRTTDVCANWCHDGIETERRTNAELIAKGSAFGEAQAGAGSNDGGKYRGYIPTTLLQTGPTISEIPRSAGRLSIRATFAPVFYGNPVSAPNNRALCCSNFQSRWRIFDREKIARCPKLGCGFDSDWSSP
jgi:hypothetical protein